jgi:hypothetical protein
LLAQLPVRSARTSLSPNDSQGTLR